MDYWWLSWRGLDVMACARTHTVVSTLEIVVGPLMGLITVSVAPD